jgi:site-specific recombinase XerC
MLAAADAAAAGFVGDLERDVQSGSRRLSWIHDLVGSSAQTDGGTDLVIVAELLGHARLETTRGYTRPSAEDRTRALDLLLVDK